jgi:hypothetical protein
MPTPPVITAVTPLANATDVVLGTKVTVTFDQIIDHTTINDATFSLQGPGQTAIITPEQTTDEEPTAIQGREFITGTFTFDETTQAGKTIVTFKPDKPLDPNKTFSVLILGGQGVLSAQGVTNVSGQLMGSSYTWNFTTGQLNLIAPPAQSPLSLRQRIDTTQIKIVPSAVIGNDLTQEIDFIFPANIDPASFNLTDIAVSVSAMLGDPDVTVPSGLTSTAVITGNILRITINGWPV